MFLSHDLGAFDADRQRAVLQHVRDTVPVGDGDVEVARGDGFINAFLLTLSFVVRKNS
jgi:hypothetical protein